MTPLHKLREKLCRELAQSEYDAVTHTRREARRLRRTPPAKVLKAISAHAESMQGRFAAILEQNGQRVGRKVARAIGEIFSVLRHAVFDRVIDVERSYRATLLGLRHGADLMRLLHAVAVREGDAKLSAFCEELLAERLVLLDRAERALGWFADEPELALRSGLQLALHPGAHAPGSPPGGPARARSHPAGSPVAR